MTTSGIIDTIIEREGGYTDDPVDRGAATKFGITASTLGRWRQLGRVATREEVRHLSVTEAREIYYQQYVRAPGFDRIADEGLRAQLIDDAVLSGPRTAILALQQAVGVEPDGVLGPQTIAAVAAADASTLGRQLACARALRLADIVRRDPSQSRFIVGWLRRALGFIS